MNTSQTWLFPHLSVIQFLYNILTDWISRNNDSQVEEFENDGIFEGFEMQFSSFSLFCICLSGLLIPETYLE